MGAKRRRRFVFESECFYESRTINCTCWKRFRWTLLDDEEYDGDDEREVCEIMPTPKLELDEEVGPCEIMLTQKLELETDERDPHCQDQKLELTPSEREKGAILAYPDLWGPLTTDEEDMEHLLRDIGGLVLGDTEGWGLLPDLWDLNSKAERPASYNYQAEVMDDESCDDISDDNLTWAPDLDSTVDFAFDDLGGYINPAVQEEIRDKPDPILLNHFV